MNRQRPWRARPSAEGSGGDRIAQRRRVNHRSVTSRSAPRHRAAVALAAMLASMLALGGVAPAAQATDPPVTGTTPTITGKVQSGETVTAEPGEIGRAHV